MVNLIVGFSGAAILSLIAKRMGKTQEMAKMLYGLSCLFVILFCVTVVREGSLFQLLYNTFKQLSEQA